ncbi:RNA polymerase [Acidobacteria bacterium Mor1]|nr:RNA polymerase [Acidobacteria bacterium Mor1]
MKLSKRQLGAEAGDETLVAASMEGDRQAFGAIVARYQRLLCSLAYASLGNLSESEDVAQEAFVEAWKKLGNLSDPEKLKAWLCGILRHKVRHHRRSESRRPLGRAGDLDTALSFESTDPSAEHAVMKEQENALLWQALESVPETYRETLVLYYREDRSLAQVAEQLDLTEAAAKQRLSRGRKLLQEKMLSFVEGALERSTPGPAFTAGVAAVIATLAPPAKAAGAGAAAVKVGWTFKWASIVTVLASISGLIGSFFAVRANLDQSRTDRERRAVKVAAATFLGTALTFVAGMLALRYAALQSPDRAELLGWLAQGLVLFFVALYVVLTPLMLRGTRRMRAAERRNHPEKFQAPQDHPDSKRRQFKSRLRLLGVPLVHIQFGLPEEGEPTAFGWIAAGDVAFGLLFAWGGIAVAPISVGILSLGVFSVGAIGLGFYAMGTIGIGVVAMGASAIGYKAYGSLSGLGWENAFSQGFSNARDAAIGPIAYAREVNNETASTLSDLSTVGNTYVGVLAATVVLVILPAVLYSRAVRKRMRVKHNSED